MVVDSHAWNRLVVMMGFDHFNMDGFLSRAGHSAISHHPSCSTPRLNITLMTFSTIGRRIYCSLSILLCQLSPPRFPSDRPYLQLSLLNHWDPDRI